ncbi:SLC13 family permease [Enterococcus alishanensis]
MNVGKVLGFIKQNCLFSGAFLLAIIASFIGRFSLNFVDWKVILTLFGLMLVIQGFEVLGVLRFFAEKLLDYSNSNRQLIQLLVLLSLVGSMFLTNDVAVLTLLPIYLKLYIELKHFKGGIFGAVLIVVAANLGSSFFPFGNPQNLYLYHYYHVPLGQFLLWMAGLLALSCLFLFLLTLRIPKETLPKIVAENDTIDKKGVLLFSLLMGAMILVVLGLLPDLWTVIGLILVVFCYQKDLLKRVDYLLLLTFVCFFIIVGNIAEAAVVRDILAQLLSSAKRVYLIAIALSQVISNVPAAFLMAPFTQYHQALILGVNVGGLGTLIASLANLIGLNIIKLYTPEQQKSFIKIFTLVNFSLLIAIGCIILFFIH